MLFKYDNIVSRFKIIKKKNYANYIQYIVLKIFKLSLKIDKLI